jgi:tetratricopeptide (TPR) repeat protein
MKKLAFVMILLLTATGVLAGENSLQQAWDHAWKGDYKAAVNEYRTFAKTQPDHPQAVVALYNAASIALTQMGQKDEAGKLFAELVNKYPDTRWAAESCRRLSLIALEGKRPQEASGYFRQALAKARTKDYQMPETWIAGLAQDWRSHLPELGNPALAMEMYQEVLKVMPPGESAAQTQFELAGMLKTSGKEEQAASILADMMLGYPHTRWASRTVQEERDMVSRYKSDFPWDDVQALYRAAGLMRAGNFATADSIFADVKTRRVGSPLEENAIFGRIGSALYLNGDFTAAVDQLRDYLARYPKAYRLRDAERRLEAWGDIARMEASLADDPQDYATHCAVGFTQLQMRFNTQAQKHFRAALVDTTTDQARLGLGYACVALGQVEEGVENLETYLKNHSTEANVFNQVGYAYMNMGQIEKALSCFERYRDLEPNNPNAHDSYAECLMNMDRLDEAAAEYRKALEINPSFDNAYYMLGQVYTRKGENTSALEYFKKYLTLAPTGALADQAQAAVDSISGNRE